ncbi:MAG: hypothetical protein ABII39_06960 [Candidatus Micrarchaeota archaeon]|nr:hypothetical protein [Patescibacteria group bacterium]
MKQRISTPKKLFSVGFNGDVLGGARIQTSKTSAEKDKLRKFIQELHQTGVKFNYTCNSISFANK